MGRVDRVEIEESAEELLKRSRNVSHPLAQARLRAFHLYKSGKAREYRQIAFELGYERHAVGQWFKCYREKGLAACLEIDPGGNKRESVIKGKALEELKAKLSDPLNYFSSYKQIQQWLQEEHDIHLSYKHVHKFVHQYLGA
ncbi:MAG: helix-turn-helix domain-containing protein, partial [Bacteroidetes bacterium]|nr:helix-turn-helix domain-containing protein [Bacteroidota bacterium]